MSNVDFSDTVQAKSDQMNAIDFIGGAQTYTVTGVKKSPDKQQPMLILVDGHAQPYKPSLGYRRIITAVWGMNGNDYVGKKITLDLDPTVIYGGKEVGGICVTAMQGLSEKKRFKLAISRSKHKFVDVMPITQPVYDDKVFSEALPKAQAHINAGKMTVEQAIAHFEKTAQLTEAQKAQIKQPVQGNK
ncbi:MAG: hypothetical protein ACPG5Z_06565 [Pseudoalteromonas sp.]